VKLAAHDGSDPFAYAAAARRLARRLQAHAEALTAAADAAAASGSPPLVGSLPRLLARGPAPIAIPRDGAACSAPAGGSGPGHLLSASRSPRIEFVEVSPNTAPPSPRAAGAGAGRAAADGAAPEPPRGGCDAGDDDECDVVPCFPTLSLSSSIGSFGASPAGRLAAVGSVALRSGRFVPMRPAACGGGEPGAPGREAGADAAPSQGLMA
jgi:hypothetical protein